MELKELPESERPMSKLRFFGAEVLSNSDLLLILTGAKDTKIGSMILSEFGGIEGLCSASIEELGKMDGISSVTAAKLIAALELGKRISSSRGRVHIRIGCPEDVADFVMDELRHKKNEHFMAILLNCRHEIIKISKISIGGITHSPAAPMDVFYPVVKHGASGIILVHNHPSGDPTPSEDDIASTHRLIKAGELLGAKVVDHVIIGDGTFHSLKASGNMDMDIDMSEPYPIASEKVSAVQSRER